jgi:hypothetical protein
MCTGGWTKGLLLVENSVTHQGVTLLHKKGKADPLHAMEALGGIGGIAPTHSRPRH